MHTVWLNLRVFAANPSCNLNNFGYAPIQWALGLISFWAPKIMQSLFEVRKTLQASSFTLACSVSQLRCLCSRVMSLKTLPAAYRVSCM